MYQLEVFLQQSNAWRPVLAGTEQEMHQCLSDRTPNAFRHRIVVVVTEQRPAEITAIDGVPVPPIEAREAWGAADRKEMLEAIRALRVDVLTRLAALAADLVPLPINQEFSGGHTLPEPGRFTHLTNALLQEIGDNVNLSSADRAAATAELRARGIALGNSHRASRA